jgi:hypothetical protein
MTVACSRSMPRMSDRLAVVQGTFFLVSGLWPIVHMRSFERVTGPKKDDWLVKTMGALIGGIGATLVVDGLKGRGERSVLLGASSASVLAASDLIYVARGTIARVYLADASAELAIVALWAALRASRAKDIS